MCTCDPRSAFHWWAHMDTPSIFAADPAFRAYASGRTASQASSEVVERVTKETGRSPGSVRGLSSRGDALIEESEHKRRAKARSQDWNRMNQVKERA